MRDSKSPIVQRPLSHIEIRGIVFGVMLALFLAALDQTIVATALPTIGRNFGEIENLSWVVTAYLLTGTAVTPLYGKLSDIHGRRAMLLVGILIFVAGSVACALAPSMTALILGRALQGLGGGGLISLVQTIIADVVSPRERGRYMAYIGTVFATASVGGPVLGGVLAQHLHWTLIFWINVPLGFAALAMSYSRLKRLPRHDRPHKLDIIGAVLMMAAAVLMLLALTWGGTRYPWASTPILSLVTGSAVLWALFAWRLATAPEPFLPLAVLANPVVRYGSAAATCAMGTLIGLTIFVPLYFEAVLRLLADQSGLALIPLMGATVIASTLTGRAMAKVRHYKRMPLSGLSLAIAGMTGLALWPQGLPFWLSALLLACTGAGIGAVFPVATISVQNAVTPHQLGTATAAMNFFRSLGGATMVAAFGAIVLGGVGVAAGSGHGIESLVAAARASGADLASVFRWVFAAAAAILAVGLVFVILLEERTLRSAIPVQTDPLAPAATAVPAE
jgi:EmrB/QacA subfamily drug resistance transporter